ncbi:hypothetical protein [Actinomycetospora sp. NBRC 106378]|uniref:hypothetical protein n=1 Tax=Actinomycetospora sp. NBRC 106378 TaxID=3032208 RepID=UPI002554440E|nr:hypothetical protein [Actinomycetospora sp. NBRC 106378]
MLVTGLYVGGTSSQVTGRCSAPTIIGGMIQGFAARATVLDGSSLTGRTDAAHAPAARVGQEVSVEQPLAATAVNAWVVSVHDGEFTASVDPPPSVAVISDPPRGILRPGQEGRVQVNTIFVSKTLLTPVAALTSVPGRPDLATLLVGGGLAPSELELRRIEAIDGDYAIASLTDDGTARDLGLPPPRRDRGWYDVVVPDRLCRTAAVWPPMLVTPRTAVIDGNY